MVFVMGGVKKYKITSDFLKLPSCFEPLRVKTMSHIGGVGPSKKEEKFPLFEKFPTEGGGGGGLERVGWFPTFDRF